MATPRTRRRPLACVLIAAVAAALAAGALIRRRHCRERRRRRRLGSARGRAGCGQCGSWCARIPPGYAHPPANRHSAHVAAAAALGRAGAGHGRADPPPLCGAGDQHATDAVRHRRRRPGRPAGRLRPDRAQPHHRRAGKRRGRQGGAVPHVAGRRPAGRRRRGRGVAARAGLLVARAGQERGADVLRRDLHRPGPDPAPARPRDHAGLARRQRARAPPD